MEKRKDQSVFTSRQLLVWMLVAMLIGLFFGIILMSEYLQSV